MSGEFFSHFFNESEMLLWQGLAIREIPIDRHPKFFIFVYDRSLHTHLFKR